MLLHGLLKVTPKIPQREIDIASERWEDFKVRMDAARRVRPRAAGHDAPPKRRRKTGR